MHQITNNQNHNTILLEDFNWDVALVGRQHSTNYIPPTNNDL
jgi:hypothetical protein